MSALQDLAARLAIPGLPDWTGLLALLVLLLTALAYLLMPFSVFGLKGRMEGLEAQLDEVQAEIRSLSLRLADQPRRAPGEDWIEPPGSRRAVAPEPPMRATPPVPPPATWPDSDPRSGRAEPRLDWPGRR
jgi:hypothetical protein